MRRLFCVVLLLFAACAGCGSDESTPSNACTQEQVATSTPGTIDQFVRPSYVPIGFKVEVFEDRGPRRVLLTGKALSGLVPVVDLQLFAPESGVEVRAEPVIRQDAASKYSAKWTAGDHTILATAAFVSKEEFDKIIRSIALASATELCAFVREHDGRLISTSTLASP